MEIIKTTSNMEFDVIYADGTRRHVTGGVLHEVDTGEIIFHNGTKRPEEIIAAAEYILKTLRHMDAGLALIVTTNLVESMDVTNAVKDDGRKLCKP